VRLFAASDKDFIVSKICRIHHLFQRQLTLLVHFGAHTQYVELALRELGFNNVFPHVGAATQINLRGKHVFPLVTGTFGGVDFLHSVIGEASDHVVQSEVDEMKKSLNNAQQPGGPGADFQGLTGLLSKVPGTRGLCDEAENLQRDSDAQAALNRGDDSGGDYSNTRGFDSDRGWNPMSGGNPLGGFTGGGQSGQSIANLAATDPQQIVKKIYPILEFRDKVVRAINGVISKIPGLEKLVDKITETVTLFVMRLLAPYVLPLVSVASNGLKQGSSAVIHSSTNQQYLVFEDPRSSDPTHRYDPCFISIFHI